MAITKVNVAGYLSDLFQTGRRPNTMLRLAGHFAGRSIGEPFAYKQTTAREFPIGAFYSLDAPAQPAILEGANAPAAATTSLTQSTNVVQLYHETVSVSYLADSDKTISGVIPIAQGAAQGSVQNPRSMEWQVARKLEKIARDLNYTCLNGTYANPADPSAAALKSRGVLTAITTHAIDNSGAGTPDAADYRGFVDGALAQLITSNGYLIDETFVAMAGVTEYANLANAYRALGTVFLTPEMDMSGIKIRKITTTFGTLLLALDPDIPDDQFAILNMSEVGLVGLEVPGKGVLFEEPLYKQGSADQTQLYGQIGLDHGPEYLHALVEVPADSAIA